MEIADGVTPQGLGQDGPDVLLVHWSNGHEGRLGVRDLRLACPCAQCVDEWTGERQLRSEDVAADVRPRKIEPVGLYALSIEWSDGHSTGIYTFERLAQMCQCDACAAPAPPDSRPA